MRRRIVVVRRTTVRVAPGERVLPAGLASREMRNVLLVIASLFLFLLGLGLSQKMADDQGRSLTTLDGVLSPFD